MKCQLEPSDEIVKLEYKDWPLLFKVCDIKYIILLNLFYNLINFFVVDKIKYKLYIFLEF